MQVDSDPAEPAVDGKGKGRGRKSTTAPDASIVLLDNADASINSTILYARKRKDDHDGSSVTGSLTIGNKSPPNVRAEQKGALTAKEDKVSSAKKICTHGKKHWWDCKECGGSRFCSHGRRKAECRDCDGSAICVHGRQKPKCKPCGGVGICLHGRRKAECRECKGSAICEHGRQRYCCKDCGGPGICEHDKRRVECKYCKGASICEHSRQRTKCKECGGSGICKHSRRKGECKECGGQYLCAAHGRRKDRCKDCARMLLCPHNQHEKQCEECMLLSQSNQKCPHGKDIKDSCYECSTIIVDFRGSKDKKRVRK
jgi:hypothetical protein